MPIVLCQVFPSSATKKRPADQIKQDQPALRRRGEGRSAGQLLETWPLFADAQGDAKPEEFPDLLHPNKAGYAKWAARIAPDFCDARIDGERAVQFTPEPGFVSLFNGHDLTGWGYRPTSPPDMRVSQALAKERSKRAAWPIVTKPVTFDGQSSSCDGRYVARERPPDRHHSA